MHHKIVPTCLVPLSHHYQSILKANAQIMMQSDAHEDNQLIIFVHYK